MDSTKVRTARPHKCVLCVCLCACSVYSFVLFGFLNSNRRLLRWAPPPYFSNRLASALIRRVCNTPENEMLFFHLVHRKSVCMAKKNPLVFGRSYWFSFKVEEPIFAICAAHRAACVCGFAPLEHRTPSILVRIGTGGAAVVT